MSKEDEIKIEEEPKVKEEPKAEETVSIHEEAAEIKAQAKKTIQKLKETVKEEDPKLSPSVTLRTILGGDFLTAEMVRHQIWLILLIVTFAVFYVAFRYQCQQDLITIDKKEKELLDAKYKALSSSSTLTEKCRESHVLDALKNNKDSVLHIADQPPYIINVPE